MNLFIDQKLKHIKRDRTFKARITEKVCDGKYTIIYQNRYYTARCPAELTAGETVYVCAPDNNWSELFINLPCSRREFELVRNQCVNLTPQLISGDKYISANGELTITSVSIAEYQSIQLQIFLTDMVSTLQIVTLYKRGEYNNYGRYQAYYSTMDMMFETCIVADFSTNTITLIGSRTSTGTWTREFNIRNIYGFTI